MKIFNFLVIYRHIPANDIYTSIYIHSQLSQLSSTVTFIIWPSTSVFLGENIRITMIK